MIYIKLTEMKRTFKKNSDYNHHPSLYIRQVPRHVDKIRTTLLYLHTI